MKYYITISKCIWWFESSTLYQRKRISGTKQLIQQKGDKHEV